VNCYRIQQKSLNFIYPFKFYSNFSNKNVNWLHFSWATQHDILCNIVLDLFISYIALFGCTVAPYALLT